MTKAASCLLCYKNNFLYCYHFLLELTFCFCLQTLNNAIWFVFQLVSALLVVQKVYPHVTTNEGFKTIHNSVKHLLYTLDSPAQGIVLPSYCIQLRDTKTLRNMKHGATEVIICRWYYSSIGKYASTKSGCLANQREGEMAEKEAVTF